MSAGVYDQLFIGADFGAAVYIWASTVTESLWLEGRTEFLGAPFRLRYRLAPYTAQMMADVRVATIRADPTIRGNKPIETKK